MEPSPFTDVFCFPPRPGKETPNIPLIDIVAKVDHDVMSQLQDEIPSALLHSCLHGASSSTAVAMGMLLALPVTCIDEVSWFPFSIQILKVFTSG